MTTPAPADREALAELIQQGISEFERQIEGCYIYDEDMLKIVDRILARWRLVPVDVRVTSFEVTEDGKRVTYTIS
jgi:hypothetical protein